MAAGDRPRLSRHLTYSLKTSPKKGPPLGSGGAAALVEVLQEAGERAGAAARFGRHGPDQGCTHSGWGREGRCGFRAARENRGCRVVLAGEEAGPM